MQERITVQPNIHFGKPCGTGTRVPVQDVLELVREGLSFSVIIRGYYPDIDIEDVKACISYAMSIISVEDIHIAPTF